VDKPTRDSAREPVFTRLTAPLLIETHPASKSDLYITFLSALSYELVATVPGLAPFQKKVILEG
jgi:hypothetical protein